MVAGVDFRRKRSQSVISSWIPTRRRNNSKKQKFIAVCIISKALDTFQRTRVKSTHQICIVIPRDRRRQTEHTTRDGWRSVMKEVKRHQHLDDDRCSLFRRSCIPILWSYCAYLCAHHEWMEVEWVAHRLCFSSERNAINWWWRWFPISCPWSESIDKTSFDCVRRHSAQFAVYPLLVK